MLFRRLAPIALLATTCAAVLPTPQLKGTVDAAYDVIERLIPGSKKHFKLSIVNGCIGVPTSTPCVVTSNGAAGTVDIAGTSASELTWAIGEYLRQDCNMTIGWPRGGNSNVFLPTTWPMATAVTRKRIQPWSYFMNVCTHSYSLVWYNWAEWTTFIDWMALSGINLVLAMTGQEEIQWKVFTKFGLNDTQIRSWFNGPALLTWSRGQNEYGSDIAGPLPRSWMKSQWALQKQILARYRSLGIVGQLPGFQGNVPIGMKTVLADSNMTDNKKGTAWMDSLDPNFGKIADEWMKTLIEDFGTDHWYQLDGYFDGGTAPWFESARQPPSAAVSVGIDGSNGAFEDKHSDLRTRGAPACVFDAAAPGYIVGCASDSCAPHSSLTAAQVVCGADTNCGGVTKNKYGSYEARATNTISPSPDGETSWLIKNLDACHPPKPIVPDPTWLRRGRAAYGGLNRTDPDAIWSFQGWAIGGWYSHEQAQSLRGFIDATPKDHFVVIDMSVNGKGEWQKWNNASYWGAKFIWTTLHDFGGTDGMKGNLRQINEIPFAGMAPEVSSSVWGTGFTPEGIDQNPVYYEFMIAQNFREMRVQDITESVVARSHRRYGIATLNDDVTAAWRLLIDSAYAQDLSVQDETGVGHVAGDREITSQFLKDNRTPSATLCKIFKAWEHLITASAAVDPNLVTFRYDLVNLGRELLAQLTSPAALNFSVALKAEPLEPAAVKASGSFYAEVLRDIDTLVGTDSAFLLGPWIAMARSFADDGSADCANNYGITTCADFYEWNARVQLTSWNPTPVGATVLPDGPLDYAQKHWSGLIADYYAPRVEKIMTQALTDAATSDRRLNKTAVDLVKAQHAYTWQLATNKFPTQVVGNALAVSKAMLAKYRSWYATC